MNKDTHVENWESLAIGVVTQAVDDYKNALNKKRALERELHSIDKTIVECEKFFDGQWCLELLHSVGELNGVNGQFVKENAAKAAEKEYGDYNVTVTVRMKKKKNKIKDDE